MKRYALHEAAAVTYQLVDATNEYITETEPWKLASEDEAAGRLTRVLFDISEAVRIVGILLGPVMPNAGREIVRRMGDEASERDQGWTQATTWRTESARTILRGESMWPRLETKNS